MSKYSTYCSYSSTYLAAILFLQSTNIMAAWQFDWEKRTDRYGLPPGAYEISPFPITDTTASYSIETDEGSITYMIGEKFYVDGKAGNDSNNGLSLTNAKKTISAAIASSGDGNKTILVRGAHDGFDGVYSISSPLHPNRGVDNAHRFTICGYGQERPILDGGNGSNQLMQGTGDDTAYVNIQRLKFQNAGATGLRPGSGALPKKDAYFNTIDVIFYNCTSQPGVGSGNLYYFNVDNGWIFHVTSEHTTGHGIKCGNTIGCSNTIIEWCYIDGCGWYEKWDGPKEWWGSHPQGISIPADSPNKNENITIRYNIVKTTLHYGIMIRRTINFSIHHNEIYDAIHYDQISGAEASSNGRHQILLLGLGAITTGHFYNNIVRDPGNAKTSGISIQNTTAGTDVNIFNNQIYGNYFGIDMGDGIMGNFRILNNCFYVSNTDNDCVIYTRNSGKQTTIENNILFQAGTGKCLRFYGTEPTHQYNVFYAPNGGKIGVDLGVGDDTCNPKWEKIPSGFYQKAHFKPTKALLGKPQDLFNFDFLGIIRKQWQKGCLEADFNIGVATQGSVPPNVRNRAFNPRALPLHTGWIIPVVLNNPGDARLTVYDPAGRTVRDILFRNLPTGKTDLQWDEADGDGNPVKPGAYVFSVKSASVAAQCAVITVARR